MTEKLDHLNVLNVHLSHERSRLALAKTEKEAALRRVWVAQLEKEIAKEEEFIGIQHTTTGEDALTDDDLLSELARG